MRKQILILKRTTVWLFVGTFTVCAVFSENAAQGSSSWQRVGGINLAYGSYPAAEPVPGSYNWPWSDDNGDGTTTYAKYTFNKFGGQRYGILYVDNSIDSNDAYITQSFPMTIPIGHQCQQFLAYALPQGGATGVWLEIDYGSGYSDRVEWGGVFTWKTSYMLGQNLGATSGTGYTIKIGALKDPAVTTGTRSVFIDKAMIWDWSAVTPQWQNWTFDEMDYPEPVAVVENEAAAWQLVGGINIDYVDYPAGYPPGDYNWPYSDNNGDGTTTYAKYTFPKYGGRQYAVLSVDNAIDSYDAYITQTITGLSLPSGFMTQQFVAHGAHSRSSAGLWYEISYGGTEADVSTQPATNVWDTKYTNFTVDDPAGGSQYTLKIGILRKPDMTTGTRYMAIDKCMLWDWTNVWPEWKNWTFDDDESVGSTKVSESGPTSDTYEIVLTAGAPSVGDVSVTINPDIQTEVNGSGAGNSVQISFSADNWDIPQTITVTAIDDDDFESWQTSLITHTINAVDPCYSGIIVRPLTVFVSDNDELPSRSCYDPCELVEPFDVIDMDDLARLTANWLQPYKNQLALRPLKFRAILAFPNGGARYDPPLTDSVGWTSCFDQWNEEGFNAVVYLIGCELFGGWLMDPARHAYLDIVDYPEAREMNSAQVQANRNALRTVLSTAKQYGFENYLWTTHIHVTTAFAQAHDIAVAKERSELTRAYTESLYAEFSRTYPQLDGYYGSLGECVPGRQSEWFGQAIVPGLNCTGGREQMAVKPRFIVVQWQSPLEQYIEDIVPTSVYDNTWLGIHAYNGEQITDAEPWPFVTTWAKRTGLPTVVMIYPANISHFPFNSPEFAYEIANEIKKIPNIRGFVYWEHSGRILSSLFRKALAYYASNDEEYSDELWLDILEAEYGNRTAAEHFLQAFKLSARIMPDKDALFFCPHDNLKRELNMPYAYWQLNQDRPWNWQSSRVRGKVLVPVWHYASMIAENPSRFEGKDGTEAANQYPVFRTDGGSAYDIIPPNHMASIRQAGQDAYDAALAGESAATANQTKATHMRMYMQGYMLLSKYFETKVAATVEAFIAAKNGSATRKTNAQTLANQAYNEWVDFYNFCMIEDPNLNDLALYYHGRDLQEIGLGQETMADLLNEELNDKNSIGSIFGW